MSDYNIKIGVYSRSASRGVKSFTSDLNASLKALRDFDKNFPRSAGLLRRWWILRHLLSVSPTMPEEKNVKK